MSKKSLPLINCILLLVITVFLILSLSKAWLAISDSVSAADISVKLDDGRSIVLASKGESSANRSLEELLGYSSGTSITVGEEVFYTTLESDNVCLSVTPESNFNNHGEDGYIMYPGDSGSVTFCVMMSEGEAVGGESASLRITSVGYKETAENTLSEVDDASVTELLKGHIMFFTNRDAEGFYSGWVNDGENFTVTLDAGQRYKEVTLYWVWTPYFEQFIENSPHRRSICAENSTDMDGIIADIKSNPRQYLLNGENEFPDGIGDDQLDRINEFHDLYNSADEVIGTLTDLILFKISLE